MCPLFATSPSMPTMESKADDKMVFSGQGPENSQCFRSWELNEGSGQTDLNALPLESS